MAPRVHPVCRAENRRSLLKKVAASLDRLGCFTPDRALSRRPGLKAQLSRKLRSFLLRLGCFSFLSAFASICLLRSRVTENCWPTSSSVWSVFMPRRKRSHGSSHEAQNAFGRPA